MERHKRTLAKTITWRLWALVITWMVVYVYNRDVKQSTAISITANGLKVFFYYLHERLWNRFSFGREKMKEEAK